MAALPISRSRDHWITPQEQLDRLQPHFIEEISARLLEEGSARLLEEVSEKLLPVLAPLVFEYTNPIPMLTDWCTALERLNRLPEKIPPLPNHILHILGGKCPIFQGQMKADGTPYRVWDTHSLYLVPPLTTKEFERDVYRKNLFVSAEIRAEHGNAGFRDWQWILMSDPLPGSQKLSYKDQARMVADLGKKFFVKYEIPFLREVSMVCFLRQVATGNFYQGNNRSLSLRVQEAASGCQLIVKLTPKGLQVDDDFELDDISPGIVAVRRLS